MEIIRGVTAWFQMKVLSDTFQTMFYNKPDVAVYSTDQKSQTRAVSVTVHSILNYRITHNTILKVSFEC